MFKRQAHNILALLFIILFVNSCKHELETPTWNVDLITPLINTEINIDKIIVDDSLFNIQSDDTGLVSLFFNNNLSDINYDSLINIDKQVPGKTSRLDSIKFDNINISDTTTMGQLISTIPLGGFLFPNGSSATIPFIPNVISSDTFNVNASDYFETMTLIDGYLFFEIQNNLPVDISNISCSLMNSTNQNIIASFYFPLITSGTSDKDSISLAGLTIDKNIEAIINNVDVNASNGNVIINYSDALIAKIKLKSLRINEATAYFPEQELSKTLTETSFDLGDAQITEIGIKTGIIKIHLVSTIPDTGRIIYNIPSLTKNGIAFSTEKIVPTTINGEATIYTFDFKDYILNLKGKNGRIGGDTINTIYSELFTYIDSTGELITLNQEDSFYYHTEFIFSPKYALGYLGSDTIEIGPEEIETTVFNNIVDGEINLNNTTLSIEIDNYFGAEANLVFSQFDAINSRTGITSVPTVDQNGNTFIGNTYNINRAFLLNNNPEAPNILPSSSSIILDADQILNILPNKINTSFSIYINPQGQTSFAPDFLFTDFPLEASIQLKIPLNLIANNLQLIDTADLDISINDEIEIEKLYLKVENGFPINCDIKLILLDNNQNIIDTLFNNNQINSGILQNNIVIEKSINLLETDNVNLKDVKQIIFDATFLTNDLNEYVSIYNDYSIDFLLSAKFSTQIN
ncbi:MAG: hypothetical protein P8J77_03095 [Flavobacteriales bacterium]|nr:hypothetical protein [Flavobacteriales bacterium]